MVENIKGWIVCISTFVGIAGGMCLLDFYRLRNEIDSLNQQIEQQNMLIDYLEQEVSRTREEQNEKI